VCTGTRRYDSPVRGGSSSELLGVSLLVLLVLSAVSCHAYQRGSRPPVFPAAAGPTVLAIRDPLDARELSVEARVVGTNARQAPLWMLVDSGASSVSLPAELTQSLGMVTRGRAAVSGPTRPPGTAVAVVPELALGDLVFRQLLVGISKGSPTRVRGILGQSVLRQAPWEISWDRGTVTLGAQPGANAPGVHPMPLRRMERYPTDEIEVRINGQPVKMLFDTGASLSRLPEDVAASLGLSSEPVPPLPFFVGVPGVVNVSRLYTGSLAIGGTEIDRQVFVGVPAHSPAVLGLDVLSRFNLLVVPGQRALLTARADVRTTAAARIARWAWVPKTCAAPGCVQARIGPDRLELVVEAKLPGSVNVLLGCAGPVAASPFQPPDGVRRLHEELDRLAGRSLLPATSTSTPSSAPSPADERQFRHLAVRMFGLEPGPRTVVAPRVGEQWFSAAGLGCRDLEVLDVVPLPAATDSDTTVLVELVP
jgi:predicted aspartyl protease